MQSGVPHCNVWLPTAGGSSGLLAAPIGQPVGALVARIAGVALLDGRRIGAKAVVLMAMTGLIIAVSGVGIFVSIYNELYHPANGANQDNQHGDIDATPQQQGFQKGVTDAHQNAPDHEEHRRDGRRRSEDINHDGTQNQQGR